MWLFWYNNVYVSISCLVEKCKIETLPLLLKESVILEIASRLKINYGVNQLIRFNLFILKSYFYVRGVTLFQFHNLISMWLLTSNLWNNEQTAQWGFLPDITVLYCITANSSEGIHFHSLFTGWAHTSSRPVSSAVSKRNISFYYTRNM